MLRVVGGEGDVCARGRWARVNINNSRELLEKKAGKMRSVSWNG